MRVRVDIKEKDFMSNSTKSDMESGDSNDEDSAGSMDGEES